MQRKEMRLCTFVWQFLLQLQQVRVGAVSLQLVDNVCHGLSTKESAKFKVFKLLMCRFKLSLFARQTQHKTAHFFFYFGRVVLFVFSKGL